MCTDRETALRIQRRAGQLRGLRKRWLCESTAILAFGAAAAVFMCVLAAARLLGSPTDAYGDLATLIFDNAAAGGYVLAALVSFTAGVVTALLCERRKNRLLYR